MTYNADIEEFLQTLTDIEGKIGNLNNDLMEARGEDARQIIKEIKELFNKAKQHLSAVDLEIGDITDEAALEAYKAKYDQHSESLKQLEADFNAASASSRDQPKQGTTSEQLMGKALDLQEQQKNSLQNSLGIINDIQQVGTESLDEIHRQQDQLGKAIDNMEIMDSELERAKKIMHTMATRAAGDWCVRILAILVVAAVVAVIVVEIVSPGSAKKQFNGWFESASDNTGIVTPTPDPTPQP